MPQREEKAFHAEVFSWEHGRQRICRGKEVFR
jgi:hypothetical protein